MRMESASTSAEALKLKISDVEDQLKSLRAQLAEIEAKDKSLSGESQPRDPAKESPATSNTQRWPLTPEEYNRYGRQMIVPSIGIQG